jgi:hypothetical protein
VPKPASQTQLVAVEAIRQAILAEGDPAGPASARRKFPDTPGSTWSRWTAPARQQVADDDLRQRTGGIAEVEMSAADKLGSAAPVAISWTEQIAKMLAQCDLLVAQAVQVDKETGLSRVRAPMVLRQAIGARTAILRVAAERESVVFGAERVRFWEGELSKAIGAALGRVQSDADRQRVDRVIAAMTEVFERREVERVMLSGSLTPERAREIVMKSKGARHGKA